MFPAESYAEKEGTVTHPDGRIQRLRQSIKRPGEVRPQRTVLLDLISALLGSPARDRLVGDADRAGLRGRALLLGHHARGDRRPGRALARARGVRGQARRARRCPTRRSRRRRRSTRARASRSAPRPSLWGSRVTEHSPTLRFLAPRQRAEISAADAERLGIAPGDEVEVSHERHHRPRDRRAARRARARQRLPARGHERGQRELRSRTASRSRSRSARRDQRPSASPRSASSRPGGSRSSRRS